MGLTTILTIASEFMQVAAAIVQDCRQQATADEVARLRAATQAGIAVIEADAADSAAPGPPQPPSL
jgi:hypothetical protein